MCATSSWRAAIRSNSPRNNTARHPALANAQWRRVVLQVRATLHALAADLPPRAIKIGMLGGEASVLEVGAFLAAAEAATEEAGGAEGAAAGAYAARPFAASPSVVCDPVLVSSSGARLLSEEGLAALRSSVLPRCRLLTPNLAEAEALLERRITTAAEAEAAAVELRRRAGCGAVLLKGGHAAYFAAQGEGAAGGGRSPPPAMDVLVDGEAPPVWRERSPQRRAARRLDAGGRARSLPNRLSCARVGATEAAGGGCHGTGCVLSTAIAAMLAHGHPLVDSVVLAKAYVTQGMASAAAVGAGPAPVAHTGWPSSPSSMPVLSRSAAAAAAPPRFARCDGDAARGLYPVLDSKESVAAAVAAGARDVQLRIKGAGAARVASEVRGAQAACAAAGARLWVNDYGRIAVSEGAYGVHLGREGALAEAAPRASPKALTRGVAARRRRQEDLAALTDSEAGMEELRALSDAGVRLGVSTHTFAELAAALAVGPSYVALGPVFATTSKRVVAAAAGPAAAGPAVAAGEAPSREVEPKGLAGVAHWRALLPGDVPLVAIGGISLDAAPSVLGAGAQGLAVIGALTGAPDLGAAVRAWLPLWRAGPRDERARADGTL